MTTGAYPHLDDTAPREWPAWTAAVLAAAVFAAGEPLVTGAPAFGAGYVLRRVALGAALGLLLLLAAWVPSRLGRPERRHLVWILAPLGIVLLGLLTTTQAGFRNAFRHGIVWASLGLLPLALASAFEIPRAARRTWMIVLALACLYAVFGFYELQAGQRMAASFGRPAVAGVVFGALLAPALLLIRPLWLGALAALPLALACVLSGSRAALIAAVLGLLVAAAVAALNAARRKQLRLVTAGVAVLAVVGFGLGVNDVVPLPGGTRTVEVRMGLYRAGGTLVAERPLVGHGLGRYEAEVMRVRDLTEARLEPGRRPEHAHNDILHASVEGGVLAGLLLLAWFVGAFLLGARAAADADALRRRHVGAALGVVTTVALAGLADGVIIDPGPALLAALAMASLLTMRPRAEEPRPLPVAPRTVAIVFGLLGLGATYGLRLDAAADAELQAYVNERATRRVVAAAGGEVEALGPEQLERALRYREDDAEAHYQLGVLRAQQKNRVEARTSFRRAFELDAGKTEARLDLAHTLELDDRIDDAKAVLVEATRRDPTRFDAWMRLGHLEIGPEPIPGDPPPPDVDWVTALKRYNTAHETAPNRFEYEVALARMERRKAATPEALKGVDVRLEEAAAAFAPEAATPMDKLAAAPAELIVEAFRVAEAMGASDVFTNAVLRLALKKNPDVAISMGREVDRFLTEAQKREDEAKKRAAETLDPNVFAAADRAFGAATVRLAALLEEGAADMIETLEQARAEKIIKRYRMSLARYRSLLAATQGPNAADVREGDPNAGLRWRSELLREAATVAAKVDAPKARDYWARAFTLNGMLHLNEGREDEALATLRRALDYNDAFADTHFQLARTYARRSELDDASKALLRAFELGPHWKQPAMVEPDFVALRDRPEIRRALK
ncbi:MAG: O-antigen ligase family protein [Planctomycetota bacterium]|nr:O-antigen ligase family protein [Planctomycetota bacterium]